jgi:hypothetical protein
VALQQGGKPLKSTLMEKRQSGGANDVALRTAPQPGQKAASEEELFSKILSAVHSGGWLQRRHELNELLEHFSVSDLQAMIERAFALPRGRSDQLLGPLLERWLELDASAAGEWIIAHGSKLNYEVWRIWGRTSPETALQQAHAHPLASYAGELLRSAVKAMAGPDEAKRVAQVAALPRDAAQEEALYKFHEAWAQEDPAAALAFCRNQPAGPFRDELMATTLRNWLQRNPARGADARASWVQELGSSKDAADLVGLAAGALAGKDPQRALEWLGQLPEAAQSAAALNTVASAWARADPISALEWCEANGLDPARAVAKAPAHYPGNPPLASAMSADPAKTIEWIQEQPDAAHRAALLETALGANSRLTASPVSAENAKLVAGLLADLSPEARENAAYKIGWNSQSGGKLDAVQIWVEQLPDESSRAAAIEAALKYRAGGNPSAVEAMVTRFPEGYQRDAAWRGVAAHQPPQEAVETALRISDARTRELVLAPILDRWSATHPRDAAAWIAAHPR